MNTLANTIFDSLREIPFFVLKLNINYGDILRKISR